MANKTEILKAIEEKRKEIESLEKELKVFENPYVDIDKIERGEKYYYRGMCGIVDDYNFCDDGTDRGIISECIAFTNEEYAKKVAKRELLIRKLDKFAWDNDSHVSLDDWKNNEIKKHCIYYNYNVKMLDVDSWRDFQDIGQIYFKSKEVALEAIEEFNEELFEYFNS